MKRPSNSAPEPFAISIARITSSDRESPSPRYNPTLEVLVDSAGVAFIASSVSLVLRQGSTETRTGTEDPTRDEPTER